LHNKQWDKSGQYKNNAQDSIKKT